MRENGVEPNPGPFGFRLAFRRVTGRAVFADKQKQLLDRDFARLVEQGIEPHPGPDVGASRQDDEHIEGFSWPCEACGQVLWASDMTRLSQLRPHVIGVLECRASDFHARKLRAHFASLGYRAWTGPLIVVTRCITGCASLSVMTSVLMRCRLIRQVLANPSPWILRFFTSRWCGRGPVRLARGERG